MKTSLVKTFSVTFQCKILIFFLFFYDIKIHLLNTVRELKQKNILKILLSYMKWTIETKFEYIRPVWNMYLGGFDPETLSSSDSSCPRLNQLGYRDWVYTYIIYEC